MKLIISPSIMVSLLHIFVFCVPYSVSNHDDCPFQFQLTSLAKFSLVAMFSRMCSIHPVLFLPSITACKLTGTLETYYCDSIKFVTSNVCLCKIEELLHLLHLTFSLLFNPIPQ